jgi:hypothetical protein
MQTTNNILMIRPVRFSFNEQTADSNSFQHSEQKNQDAQQKAQDEFDHMVDLLDENGITVFVVEDTVEPNTPDSIFPNNWVSFHDNALITLYPMQAENRRLERRADIIESLSQKFQIQDIIDLTAYEKENKFLEGTGSMVLDRDAKICYAGISNRTDIDLLNEFCEKFCYKLVSFNAFDNAGIRIYHTNVVMCIGEKFMVVCMECIPDESEKSSIRNSTNKTLIEISLQQLHHFAGNMLEVKSKEGESVLVMSEQAFSSLLPKQIAQLNTFSRILPVPLYSIESIGGGSARCMMAEIFLPTLKQNIQ